MLEQLVATRDTADLALPGRWYRPLQGGWRLREAKSLGVFFDTGCYIARYKSFRITRTPATP